jgi:hypothetical protein
MPIADWTKHQKIFLINDVDWPLFTMTENDTNEAKTLKRKLGTPDNAESEKKKHRQEDSEEEEEEEETDDEYCECEHCEGRIEMGWAHVCENRDCFKEAICDECTNVCTNCGDDFCPNHVKKCKTCKEKTCDGCLVDGVCESCKDDAKDKTTTQKKE